MAIKRATKRVTKGTKSSKKQWRRGFFANRTQFWNLRTRLWHKRNTRTGRVIDVKTTGGRFKNVRREH